MADGYYLNEDDVTILRQMAAAWKRGDFRVAAGEGLPPLPERADVIFGVADSPVAGTTGTLTTPGSGLLSVYKFTSTGGTTDTTYNTTVHNLSAVSRTTDQFTIAARDFRSGRWMAVAGSGDDGYKKICRFLLDAALTTSDASVAAKIAAQYGDGTAHSTAGTITAWNLLTSGTSVYLFSGSSGAAGLAYWDAGTNWRILQMECP